ncbi:DUF1552 domain-containing protein [Alienimonas chondri]|uniref:Protein containing DUF1552 n=1 Tax=Alienimonas chondri TaxID=2681879 RepID=A0ABX1VD03_9PLAN|nr:DUF1552 domain-containing protein [Alienimonas chondri]NNJ25112.1 hypothetical protein [Alienimonas chondri]
MAIALPALESIAGTKSASAAPDGAEPKRLVCLSSALGINPEAFFPKTFGRNYELSPTLRSLADLREDFTVFSHMDHPNIFTKHGSMNSLLSGVDAKRAGPGENVSIDQVVASHVGYETRFPSLHISLGGGQGASWTASGIKVREESDPLDLFRKLFVNDSAAARKARQLELEERGSVLDLVRGQAKRVDGRLNAPDRAKLDEYLTAIREAEGRIQGMRRWQDVPKPEVDFNASANPHGSMDYPTLSPLMFDLLYLAIRSDSSRAFTAGFGMHNHVIELDGVTGGYHGLTHHGNLPDRLRQLRKIDAFYLEQTARFLTKLKNAPSGNGTLLDETTVFFGSGLGDASRHSNRDLPLLLAGGGFQHGAHLDCTQPNGRQTPLNNLFTTVLQNFGVEIDRFNNATGSFAL